MRRFSFPCAMAVRPLFSGLLLAGLLLIPCTAMFAQEQAGEIIFPRIDTDHNQLISEAEYHTAMQRRFEQLDSNKDGSLSKQEWEQARAKVRKRLQERRNGTNQPDN